MLESLWMAPVEALEALVTRGFKKSEAQSLIFRALDRGVVHASGVDQTYFISVDPDGRPVVRNGEFHERADVPPLFWKKLLRVDRSPLASLSVDWGGSNFCFMLDTQDAAKQAVRGRFQECYHSVLVDRTSMELVVKRLIASRMRELRNSPPALPPASERELASWYATISNPELLSEVELLKAAKAANPTKKITRQRVRQLRGDIKKGRKSSVL
jgi:hypothetical protein